MALLLDLEDEVVDEVEGAAGAGSALPFVYRFGTGIVTRGLDFRVDEEAPGSTKRGNVVGGGWR